MDIEENYSDKKSTGYQVATLANKSAIKSMPNQQLADELHKPVIKKFLKRRVYSSYKDNIWGVDLADMQLIGKWNKGIKVFIMCHWSF